MRDRLEREYRVGLALAIETAKFGHYDPRKLPNPVKILTAGAQSTKPREEDRDNNLRQWAMVLRMQGRQSRQASAKSAE